MDRWFLLEFSTKKYVLFTTYFMSSFQITINSTWYFKRTLWPRFDSEKQTYIWLQVLPNLFKNYYSSAKVQLFQRLTGPRSQTRVLRFSISCFSADSISRFHPLFPR